MIRVRFRLAVTSLAPAALLFTLLSALTPPHASAQTAAQPPLLLRNPSLSQDKIAFLYAADIWTVSRQGGDAERLTSIGAVIDGPYYSPDGASIAYTAHLNGIEIIYVMGAEGGVPHRIFSHPGGSTVAGWTPDSKYVLMASGMASPRHYLRLFRVAADGSGMPDPLPLPMAEEGSYSPDGQSFA